MEMTPGGMLQTSQNGYTAGDPSLIRTATVPGTTVQLPVRRGPAGDLLIAAAARWHREVEPLVPGTCWGYAYRTVRGSSSTLSNHCLTGDTVVWTYDGPQPIRDLSGTTATLLSRGPSSDRISGSWVEAPVSEFGEQATYKITLARGSLVREIRATAQHRWFVQRPTSQYVGNYRSEYRIATAERTTLELKPDDALAMVLPPATGFARLSPSPFGVMHGLVYGDGTLQPSGGRGAPTCKVTLWNEKRDLLTWFPSSCPVSPRERDTGARGMEIRGLPNTYKRLPSLTESSSYLAGWLAGYFAADGSVHPDEINMSSRSREDMEFVRAVAARFGIAVRQPRVQKTSGGYKPGDQWSISFIRSTVPDWMILRAAHRENLSPARTTSQRRWKVVSVEPTGDIEPVYCATVERYGAFALDDWLLTGNSSGTAIDLNAPKHPLGTQPSASLTAGQIAAAHRIVDDYAPCLRWGGDYGDPQRGGVPGSRPDVMHIEVIASDAACLQALTSTPSSVTPTTAAAAEEEDAMDIPLQIGADGVFRAIKNCELGSSSALYSAAWVVFNVGFGPQAGVAADVRIAFRDTNGVVMGKANDYVFNGLRNDARQSVPAPDGCGSVTVEGRVYGGAIPSAERLVKPK